MAKKKTIKDVEVKEKVTKTEAEEIKEESKVDKKADKKLKKEEKKKQRENKKKEKKEGYFGKIFKELKKVVWPNIDEVSKYSLAVLIFCVILVVFFLGIDALASIIKELF